MQQVKRPYIIDQYPGYDEEDLPDSDGYQEYEEDPQYAEGEMETLYVYAYDPETPLFRLPRLNKDQVIALIMLLLALAMILALCCIPSAAAYTVKTIAVPAHFTTQQFKATIAIQATGKKEYPAIEATGHLTIYNGSFLVQQLPAHFIVTASNGTEFATDQAVTIEAGNPPDYGVASVSAHAVIPGSQSNIQPGAINAVYGSSLYLKNLAAFSGGQDAYTLTYATSQDTQNALDAARLLLVASQPIGLLAQPCTETTKQTETKVSVLRACTFVTYQAPKGVQILAVHVQGDRVFLVVRVVACITTTHFVK